MYQTSKLIRMSYSLLREEQKFIKTPHVYYLAIQFKFISISHCNIFPIHQKQETPISISRIKI